MKLMKRAKGQGLAEYALILALIAVVCIGVLGTLGQNAKTGVSKINTEMSKAMGTDANPNIDPPGGPVGIGDADIKVDPIKPGDMKTDPAKLEDPATATIDADLAADADVKGKG